MRDTKRARERGPRARRAKHIHRTRYLRKVDVLKILLNGFEADPRRAVVQLKNGLQDVVTQIKLESHSKEMLDVNIFVYQMTQILSIRTIGKSIYQNFKLLKICLSIMIGKCYSLKILVKYVKMRI